MKYNEEHGITHRRSKGSARSDQYFPESGRCKNETGERSGINEPSELEKLIGEVTKEDEESSGRSEFRGGGRAA